MTRVEAEETDIHNSLLSSGFTRIDDTETKTMLRNYKKTWEYTKTLKKTSQYTFPLAERGDQGGRDEPRWPLWPGSGGEQAHQAFEVGDHGYGDLGRGC